MSQYGYNSEIADVIRPLGQSTVKKRQTGFSTIPDVPILNTTNQTKINARDVRTGQLRGNQQIRGLITIMDEMGRNVLIMGYSPGSF